MAKDEKKSGGIKGKIDALRKRYVWFDRVLRMQEHFTRVRGNHLAGCDHVLRVPVAVPAAGGGVRRSWATSPVLNGGRRQTSPTISPTALRRGVRRVRD